MVRITRVYTKTGDQGQTQIAKGKSLPKTSARIAAIGDIDELNAFLAFAAAGLAQNKKFKQLNDKILRLQNELFDLGAQLAVLLDDRRNDTPMITEKNVLVLEQEIDTLNENLPALNSFVLPGENELVTRLHIARAVCRRAERSVVALAEVENLDAAVIPFLNRLSDWLFVAARFVTHELGISESLWQPGQ